MIFFLITEAGKHRRLLKKKSPLSCKMQASNQSTRTKNFLYKTNHFHNLSRQIQQTKINNMTAIVNVLSQKMLSFFTCLLGFSKYSNPEPQGHTTQMKAGRRTKTDKTTLYERL